MTQTTADALHAVADVISNEGINLGWPYSEDSPTLQQILDRVCEVKAPTVLAEPGEGEQWFRNLVGDLVSPVIEFGATAESISAAVHALAHEHAEMKG